MKRRLHGARQSSEKIRLMHLPVRNSKVDKAEERIKGSAEQREEVSHGGNYLGEDKANPPNGGHYRGPDTPANNRVAVCVVRVAHEVLVDVLCGHVCVDYLFLHVSMR